MTGQGTCTEALVLNASTSIQTIEWYLAVYILFKRRSFAKLRSPQQHWSVTTNPTRGLTALPKQSKSLWHKLLWNKVDSRPLKACTVILETLLCKWCPCKHDDLIGKRVAIIKEFLLLSHGSSDSHIISLIMCELWEPQDGRKNSSIHASPPAGAIITHLQV